MDGDTPGQYHQTDDDRPRFIHGSDSEEDADDEQVPAEEEVDRPKKSTMKQTPSFNSADDEDHASSRGHIKFGAGTRRGDESSGDESDDGRKYRERMSTQRRPSLADHLSMFPDHSILKSGISKDMSQNMILVELQQLRRVDGEAVWQERCRWIKYEENYEEGACAWSKPHVSCLNFNMLLQLKNSIATGLVLQMSANNINSMVENIVDEVIKAGHMPQSCRNELIDVLLLKHKHVKHGMGFRNAVRRLSSVGSHMSHMSHHSHHSNDERPGRSSSFSGLSHRQRGYDNQSYVQEGGADGMHMTETDLANNNNHASNGVANGTSNGLATSASSNNINDSAQPYTRRNMWGTQTQYYNEKAESLDILVGRVEFLKEPISVFVRFDEACYLNDVIGGEGVLPTRYIYIALGPMQDDNNYYEIGRCMGAVMSTLDFQQAAFEATGRKGLLKGISKFLDDSLMMPSGDWTQDTLMPAIAVARHKAHEVRKKSTHPLLVTQEAEKAKKNIEQLIVDPLSRTGRPFGGVWNDLKGRMPLYLSDIKDALNTQCIGAFFFIFFAALSPAITFGGLLAQKTNRWIGVTESLMGTATSGLAIALFSCQPLKIMGITGPMLVFEESLYQICIALDVEYISFHCWVFIWIGVIAVVLAAVDGNVVVKLISRFTEEVFSAFISTVFLYETFFNLYKVFYENPLIQYYDGPPPTAPYNSTMLPDMMTTPDYFTMNGNYTNYTSTVTEEPTPGPIIAQPNTALLSLILTIATFAIAWYLRIFRNGHYLGRTARRALGDFGIPIAILIMVLVDYGITDTYTKKLDVPDGLETTSTKRGWFINPMGVQRPLPIWAIFAAILPALLGFILIFMESQISGVIINKPERNLKKGAGFHWDMMLIGVMHVVHGILGFPMICAACVRCITHVNALSVYSSANAPGEKPHLLGVYEQRMTNFLVHVVMALASLLGPLLRLVPLPVLFGVFLYMGIASMVGVQFFQRIELFFMPIKYHPQEEYVSKVRTWKMHLFTVIQLVCLGALWVVKSTPASLAMPFVLIMTIPLERYLLPKIFNPSELWALNKTGPLKDAPLDDSDSEEEDNDLDFYEERIMANIRRRPSTGAGFTLDEVTVTEGTDADAKHPAKSNSTC